jgi:hypothetical protein
LPDNPEDYFTNIGNDHMIEAEDFDGTFLLSKHDENSERDPNSNTSRLNHSKRTTFEVGGISET